MKLNIKVFLFLVVAIALGWMGGAFGTVQVVKRGYPDTWKKITA